MYIALFFLHLARNNQGSVWLVGCCVSGINKSVFDSFAVSVSLETRHNTIYSFLATQPRNCEDLYYSECCDGYPGLFTREECHDLPGFLICRRKLHNNSVAFVSDCHVHIERARRRGLLGTSRWDHSAETFYYQLQFCCEMFSLKRSRLFICLATVLCAALVYILHTIYNLKKY